MPRETKAQREAREAEEQRLAREEEVLTYPQRLMLVLGRACKVNFNLEVYNERFVLYDRDQRNPTQFALNVVHTDASEYALQQLSWEVDFKFKEEEEANRKLLAKHAALAKLSKEERELLGL